MLYIWSCPKIWSFGKKLSCHMFLICKYTPTKRGSRWLFRSFTSRRIKKIIFITEIYVKKQYKSSITKNHKIKKKKNLTMFPEKATYPLKLFSDFAPERKKKNVGKIK